MKLKIGQKAPAFTLKDQNEEKHTLSQYKGEWVLLYFYPRDNTPGCTKQACEIRDNIPDFNTLSISVIGISVDSVDSHKKFQKKHDLPFTLLSDLKKEVVRKYGVWGKKKFMGKEYMGTKRISFLIDRKGKIAKIYEKVKPATHAKEVLEDVRKLDAVIKR